MKTDNSARKNLFFRPVLSTRGFTLIEIAIVLVIVGLLLGGLLMPLANQVEQKRVQETQKALEEIKEALIGFAVANDRLPRPATSATNGAEISSAVCATAVVCTGFIPWTTLGVSKVDAWGKIIRYSVDPAFATNTPDFALTTIATKVVRTRSPPGFALSSLATAVPAVVFSYGKENFGTSEYGVAMPNNSAGPTNADETTNDGATVTFISRTPSANTGATGGEFDDLVVWLPAPILFNRMVAAGRLP